MTWAGLGLPLTAASCNPSRISGVRVGSMAKSRRTATRCSIPGSTASRGSSFSRSTSLLIAGVQSIELRVSMPQCALEGTPDHHRRVSRCPKPPFRATSAHRLIRSSPTRLNAVDRRAPSRRVCGRSQPALDLRKHRSEDGSVGLAWHPRYWLRLGRAGSPAGKASSASETNLQCAPVHLR